MGKRRTVYSDDPSHYVITTDARHENFGPISRFLHNVVTNLKPSAITYGDEGRAEMEIFRYKMTAGTAREYAVGAVLIPMNFQRVRIIIAGSNEDAYRPIISARINFIETAGSAKKALKAILKANNIGPRDDQGESPLADYHRTFEFRLEHRWLFEALLDCDQAIDKVKSVISAQVEHKAFKLNDISYREAVGHITYCPQEDCRRYHQALTETLKRHYKILTEFVRPEYFSL